MLHAHSIISIADVCLNATSISDNTYVGEKGVVMGWGTLEESGRPACIIRDVEIPIVSNEYCRTSTNYSSTRITDNMMCAGYEEGMKDSCQVSSGYLFADLKAW